MRLNMFRILNQKGQSLLELIVAIMILGMVLTATVVLIVTSINAGRESRYKLIATSLAREGIEITRNIRDSNWADPFSASWNEGLNIDTTATPVIDGINPITLNFADDDFTVIKLNNSAYLQGSTASGSNTQFYRLLTFEAICRASDGTESFPDPDANSPANDCGADAEVGLRVIAEVRWPSSSSNKKIIIEDRLYDWQIL